MDLEPTSKLPCIDVEVPLMHLDDDVVQDLSADQKYLYSPTLAIKNGHFTRYLMGKRLIHTVMPDGST